jgi:xylulokinase
MWRWLRIHGMPPLGEGSESMSHMRWVKFARPEIYEQTDKFLEPMDYLALRLTGRPAANQSTMFMSLLIDNRGLNVTEYDRQLVAQSLIDVEKLPELLPLDATVGTVRSDVADELGLSTETVVFTGLNDTQSGGMATYAFTGDHAGLSVGSSSVIITHVPKKKSDVFNAILTMPSPVPDTYFVMAENGVAGGGLEHFLRHMVFASDSFGEIDQADEFQALGRAVASVAPGSDKVLFLPWLSGSLAPSADSRMRGGILNLSMQTTRSHVARAVLEGVAMNLRWLHAPVERFAKRRLSHFIYYGGGAESDEWSQIMADVLGLPIHQMADPQYATCLGAGLLACQRLDLLGFDDFAKSVAIKQVYEPRSQFRATYDELFEQFVAAFRANRKMFRTLNAKTNAE